MNTRYRILPGQSFEMGGGQTLGAGEEIELPPDIAAMHAHRLEPVQTAAPAAAATAIVQQADPQD